MKPTETGLDYVDQVKAFGAELKKRADELGDVKANMSTRLGEIGWKGQLVLAGLLKDSDGSVHPVFQNSTPTEDDSQDLYIAAGSGLQKVVKAEGLGGGRFAVDWGMTGKEPVEYDLVVGGSINRNGELLKADRSNTMEKGILGVDWGKVNLSSSDEERFRSLVGGRSDGESFNSFRGITTGMDKASGDIIPPVSAAELPAPEDVLKNRVV
jgi:hypothetical protein